MLIQVRHSANSGNAPIFLANGELAINAEDQLLYYRHANGGILVLANGAMIGIGTDQFARDHSNGAFDQANTANVTAQAAFDRANVISIIARLSSNVNQLPSNTSAYSVTYDSQDFLTAGASHTLGNSRITVTSDGIYQVTFVGRITKNSAGPPGILDCWLRKNGINVAGSTARANPAKDDVSSIVTNTFILSLAANDYIQIMQAINDTTLALGLGRATGLDGAPYIPSITLTLIRFPD